MVCDPCTPTTVAANGCVMASEMRDQEPGVEGCQDGTPPDTTTMTAESSTSMGSDPTVSTTVDPDSSGTTDGSTTSSTTSGDCDPECGGTTPYCVDETCYGCEDLPGGCEALGGGAACDTGSGLCVECTEEHTSGCPDAMPACVDNMCQACDEHAQCPDSACNMATGACMPNAPVIYVDNDDCAGGDGTSENPVCTINAGLGLIAGGVGTIRVRPGALYQEAVLIGGGLSIALVGVDGLPEIRAGVETIRATGGSNLFLANVDLRNNNSMSAVLDCDNSAVWTHDTFIRDNMGVGVRSLSGCDLALSRTRIVQNDEGGLNTVNSNVSLVNSVVGSNNLGGDSEVSGLRLQGGTFDILYSTIANNESMTFADGIICVGAPTGTIRNSIVLSDSNDTIGCDSATTMVSDSAVDQMPFIDFNNNTQVTKVGGEFDSTSDFHVDAGGPFDGLGIWRDGDPLIDFDGDARPGMDGAADYVGADVP